VEAVNISGVLTVVSGVLGLVLIAVMALTPLLLALPDRRPGPRRAA
jgi:hypothetical protein